MDTFIKRKNKAWYGLVGDAARQVDPLHGGGISTAMLAAQMCGKVISNGGPLSAYQSAWDATHRPEHIRRWVMKEALISWDDDKLNKMVNFLHGFEFETSRAPVEAARMILHLAKAAPGMFGSAVLKTLYEYAKVKF